MTDARERLAVARMAVAQYPSSAAGSAYYAMLSAARAALSEQDRYAKTHKGTWRLFGELYVVTGRFDAELFAGARRSQRTREAADYEAVRVSRERAEELVGLAERFVAAVDELFPA